ncbi:MAG TPA: ROK family protein [Ktedonobacteraceae bacterium]|nr:ROK family protein [Ktedonobacteraceae bacterium]
MNDAISADQGTLPLVIGVDIGGTQLRAAVLQGAQLLSRVSMPTGEYPKPEHTIPRVFNAIEQALKEAHVTFDSITGIGVATPGPLDNRTGIIYSPPNLPAWERVPLREIFQRRYQPYQFPIYIENDANTAALGEYMFGAGRGCKDMVYLTVSTGIGGGVIIGGKLFEGVSGTAAELGHMSIDWKGERCNCGNLGCLEYYASGTAIARMTNEAIAAGQGAALLAFVDTMLEHPTTIPDQAALPAAQDLSEPDEWGGVEEAPRVNAHTVARAAEAGIPLAREIIAQAGEALGVGLVNIIHIFNPDRIILGGGVTMMGDMLMEPARRITQERTMRAPYESVRISIAELGVNVGLIGAGALCYYYQKT